MPWCEECERFLTPSSLSSTHGCPRCGNLVDLSDKEEIVETEIDPIPWHFKVLLGLAALYLGYRAFQGVEWVINQL